MPYGSLKTRQLQSEEKFRTDNQSVVTMLPYPKATSGQYLYNTLRLAIEVTGSRLVIRWISGHSKVKGNEEADRIAKNAAEGRSSARASLPHILRGPLPMSASARKQEFMAHAQDEVEMGGHVGSIT